MRCAMAACEAACAEMRAAMTPDAVRAGLTEVDLWAEMQKGNHIRGGEWIETRILSSGPRTNPWFQECGPRVIGMGELLGFDTDLIGPYGYCADISRTWLIGGEDPSVKATDEQRRLYAVAYEHIMEKMTLLKPGVPFRDLTFQGINCPRSSAPSATASGSMASGSATNTQASFTSRISRRVRPLGRLGGIRRSATGHDALRRGLCRRGRRERRRETGGSGADHGRRV